MVGANQVAEYVLPNEQIYTYNAGVVEKTGVVVTSTAPVSLYAANFREHTYDATIVMPTTALGTNYVVQVYENDLYAKELAVVATANNTQVTIIPHARTTLGQVKGVPFMVTLQRGEVYQLMSKDSGNDFSGTCVQSDKPVAVFAGHQCINVPTGNPWCDHIVEQQLPTLMWGRQFVVTKTKGQNGDRVMLTAVNDNTKLYVNGTLKTTLNALQSYEFRLTDNSAYIETSEPATCYLYIEGARDNNMMGDPSSVHISPIEQRIKQLTFSTFQTSVSRTHYVNIVTTKSGVNSIKLDGNIISNEFNAVQGNANLMYAQIQIQNGTHTIETNIDGFVGHVYGLGDCESYAYTIGSATVPLDGQIVVDGESRSDVEYNETRCYKKSIRFEPHANVEFNTIEWSFGDGTTSAQKVVNHTYTAPGTYRIRMIITNEDGRDTAYTNLTLIEQLRDTVYADICKGDVYKFANRTYSTTGKYNVKFTSSGGCDSIVTLCLTVHDTYLVTTNATFPIGSSYRWRGKWYREEGTYYDTLTTVAGCDSILELKLTKTDPSEIMYDTICWQPTYEFKGYTFNIPSYQGFENEDYIDYVLEYRDKEACISYKMNLAIAPMVDGNEIVVYDTIQKGSVYEWYGEKLTEKGIYYKTVYQACECAIDYTLYLEVLTFPLTKKYVELCHEDTYMFRGKEYIDPGVYYDTVWSATGIDTIYEIKLVDARKRTEFSVSNVSSYTFNGKTYTKSGTYVDTLQSSAGCDSIVILHLGIREKCTISVEENIQVCEGEVIEWNGLRCEAGKSYTKTFVSSGGCDSVVALHVEAIAKETTTLPISICKGDYYQIGGQKLYTEGEHSVVFTSSKGCDSVVVVQLSYNEVYDKIDNVTIKEGESYIWQGEVYSQAGVYKKACIASNGCDSVLTLNVTILPKKMDCETIVVIDSATICYGESYKWNSKECSKSGVYVDTLQSAQGCDSVVILNLMVLDNYYFVESATIKVGKTYHWHEKTLRVEGVYYDSLLTVGGCDSIYTLTLTVEDDYAPMVIDCDLAVDLGLSVKWAPFNIGATTPEDYGDYFAWGETKPKGSYDWDTYKFGNIVNLTKYNNVDGLTTLALEDDAATVNWGGSWRMPTIEEMAELFDNCTWTWTTQNGKNGYRVTGRNGKSIFLPITGFMSGNDCVGEGENAGYWMNELASSGDISSGASITLNKMNKIKNASFYRYRGYSIRPVCVESYVVEDTVTVCYGESYMWNGKEYSMSGVYTDTLQNIQGGDSIVTLILKVLPEVVGTEENATICYGGSYKWGGVDYSVSGVYSDTLQSTQGCDSIVTLNLTVLPSYIFADTITIQEGDSYSWRGDTYEEAGVYSDSLLTIDGCDSVYTLTLIVEETIVEDVVVDEIKIEEQCAGTGVMDVEVTLTSGVVDEVSFEFSQDAIDVGLENVTLPYSNQMQVQYTDVRAGKYKLKLIGLCNGTKVFEEEKDLTFLYPSTVLMQKWNDVVAVLTHDYNGGYNFVDFKWYKNGVVLSGETRSYIHQPLEIGAEYSALLTEDNGMQLMTCPLIAINNVDISLYPTLLNSGQRVKCNVSEFAVIYIYDMMGNLVSECNVQSGETEIEMPYVAGVYMAKIVTETNKESNIKLIVR